MKKYLYLFISIFFSVLIILLVSIARPIKPFLPHLNYLLGVNQPTSYLVLLGNDTEMRANGGFAGSYAKITLSSESSLREGTPTWQSIKINSSISFQDIYVPNGQLSGYVAPPTPIQQAFGKGSWELANADWEPDYPTSAQSLRWFFVKGKEINPDNLVILNLTTIKKILNIIGPFSVSEYSAQITPDNFYLFLQGKAEVDFFPGSTQKKDALSAVGKALLAKVNSLPITKKIQIAKVLITDFYAQNIMIHSQNESFQNLLTSLNLDGSLKPQSFDTYSLIETNLGANKANFFVTRTTEHHISHSQGTLHHEVKVNFTNSSPESNPNPPIHYGGNYISYLRFYIPAAAQNVQTSGENLNNYRNLQPSITTASSSAKYGLTEIGFWHTTLAGSNTSVILTYDLPLNKKGGYSLSIIKQHGLTASPQKINIFGNTTETNLTSDFRFP